MLLSKAEVIASDNRKVLKSFRQNFPWPSVIRLKRHIAVPYKRVILTRKNIFRRDGFKCAYCGRSDLPLTVDHIVPKSMGGKDTWENMVCACTKCNNTKGNRALADAGLELHVSPYEPNFILFIKNSVGKMDENWKPYLFHH
ncbi:MAG: HNH endonuclease [Ignavibacteria bacterium]|nr:HNH endonuclease [Ignavibacteria bacterium]